MRRGPVPFVVVAAVALIGLLVYGVVTVGESATLEDALRRGERPVAPSRELPRLGGGEASVAALKGKPVILNFWASWCPPCVDELPLIQKTHEMLSKRGGTVLGIDVKENSGAALEAVEDFGLTFPNLRDRDAVLARKLGAVGYPETIVLDRKGRVAELARGPVTREWLDRVLPPLLAEKA